ncbi:hypothetical protein FDECE_6950 [Fusarium decemcellulare]|nr:hypothetical protein FDECE_6950 [Fusarium decemcellulare]
MPAAANNPGNQAWKPSADEQKETSVAWALAARKDAKDSLAEIQIQIKDLEKEKKRYQRLIANYNTMLRGLRGG